MTSLDTLQIALAFSNISYRRTIGSYSKVQSVVSRLLRGRAFQLRSRRVTAREYIDVGCGANTHEGFINLEYAWHPKIDLCWDISRGIPLGGCRVKGIFTEHCLEHLPLSSVRFLLKEFYRILRPGGVVRIIVPDAELYLAVYQNKTAGDKSEHFPYESSDLSGGLRSPLVSVNRIFYVDRESAAGHRCMFDEGLLTEVMNEAGFARVRRVSFRKGSDPLLLIDTESRSVESLYMEATK